MLANQLRIDTRISSARTTQEVGLAWPQCFSEVYVFFKCQRRRFASTMSLRLNDAASSQRLRFVLPISLRLIAGASS